RDHDKIDLKTNQFCGKIRQALRILLGKPVLCGDILSLNPPKLAHFLPKRVQDDRATGSSAINKETYAGDFRWLLRPCPCPTHHEHEDDCKKPRAFSILDFGFFDCREKRNRTEFEISFAFVFLRNPKSAI